MQQRPAVAGHAEFSAGSDPADQQGRMDEQQSNPAPPTPPSAVDAGVIGAVADTSAPGGSCAAVTPPKQQQDQSAAGITVAVGEPLSHLHDDPSPTSQQPARKQKGACGNAVPRWQVSPPAVAASAAAASADPASSSAVAALPPAAAEAAPPPLAPAAVLKDCPAAPGLPPPPPNAAPQEAATAAAAAAAPDHPLATALPAAPLTAIRAAAATHAAFGRLAIGSALPAAAAHTTSGRSVAGSAPPTAASHAAPATTAAPKYQPLAAAEVPAPAAAAMSAAGPGHSGHRYAAYYIRCGRERLVPQLRAVGGVPAVLAFGDTCGQLFQQLQDSQWVKVKYISYDSECPRSLNDKEYKVGSRDFRRGVDIGFNYGGQHLSAEQWEQRMQGCQGASTGSSGDAGGFGEAFQVNLTRDYLRFEVTYRYNGQLWFVHQPRSASLHEQLWSGSQVDKEATGAKNRPHRRIPHVPVTREQLPLFRKAAFHITVVLLLLWHAQGKQLHPALLSFAETQLGPVMSAQLATSTETGSVHYL